MNKPVQPRPVTVTLRPEDAFDLGERCVDRSREARIVQLDREVVAALTGGLLPGGAEFNVLRCTAKC